MPNKKISKLSKGRVFIIRRNTPAFEGLMRNARYHIQGGTTWSLDDNEFESLKKDVRLVEIEDSK